MSDRVLVIIYNHCSAHHDFIPSCPSCLPYLLVRLVCHACHVRLGWIIGSSAGGKFVIGGVGVYCIMLQVKRGVDARDPEVTHAMRSRD